MTAQLDKNHFLLLDKADEKQIVNAADFANDKKLVYKVHDNYELSYLLIKHLALLMAQNGHPLETVYSQVVVGGDDNGRHWYATVRVKNMTTGQTTEGVSEADYLDKDGKYDPFGRTKAHSKGERNAIKKHLPERLITKAIEDAKKKGEVVTLTPQSQPDPKDTAKTELGGTCTCPKPAFDVLGKCKTCGLLDRNVVEQKKARLGK